MSDIPDTVKDSEAYCLDCGNVLMFYTHMMRVSGPCYECLYWDCESKGRLLHSLEEVDRVIDRPEGCLVVR